MNGADRRSILKTAIGLGLAFPLVDVGAIHTAARGEPDPATARPQEGDQLVFAAGERKREAVTPARVPPGGPPLMAYPMDRATKIVRDGSRLNQILLVHLDPGDLAEETRTRAAAGIVAYSAVCTHTGCDVWEWDARARTIKCPCHFSVFDVTNAARVLDGPAPRRLPALPLKVADGVLVAAGRFVGRPGFWEFKTNSGVTGVPSSYMVDGVQYVAVQSGWGVDAQRMQARLDTFLGTKTDVPQGGVIWVFALGD